MAGEKENPMDHRDSSSRRAFRASLSALACACVATAAFGQEPAPPGEAPPRLAVSARPINLFNEANPLDAADSGYHEVWRELSRECPTLVRVTASVEAASPGASISFGADAVRTLRELVAFDATRIDPTDRPLPSRDPARPDRVPAVPPAVARLELIAESCVVESERGLERGMPAGLAPGEVLFSVWRLAWTAAVPETGRYAFVVRNAETAGARTGTKCEFREDFRLTVRAKSTETLDRFTEDRIETHYRTALAVAGYDLEARARALKLASAFAEEYLARGGGDAAGVFNVTSRYQAGLVAHAEGRSEIAYMRFVETLRGMATESKMRYGHFGVETGRLPQTHAEHLMEAMEAMKP
jgi:hypothetical protein